MDGIDPPSIHKAMQVQMPTSSLVRDFDGIKTTTPVFAEDTAPKPGKPIHELVQVPFRKVWHIFDRQNNVLGLADFVAPPLDSFFAVLASSGLTFRAVEKIAPVWKLVNPMATGTDRKSVS